MLRPVNQRPSSAGQTMSSSPDDIKVMIPCKSYPSGSSAHGCRSVTAAAVRLPNAAREQQTTASCACFASHRGEGRVCARFARMALHAGKVRIHPRVLAISRADQQGCPRLRLTRGRSVWRKSSPTHSSSSPRWKQSAREQSPKFRAAGYLPLRSGRKRRAPRPHVRRRTPQSGWRSPEGNAPIPSSPAARAAPSARCPFPAVGAPSGSPTRRRVHGRSSSLVLCR